MRIETCLLLNLQYHNLLFQYYYVRFVSVCDYIEINHMVNHHVSVFVTTRKKTPTDDANKNKNVFQLPLRHMLTVKIRCLKVSEVHVINVYFVTLCLNKQKRNKATSLSSLIIPLFVDLHLLEPSHDGCGRINN